MTLTPTASAWAISARHRSSILTGTSCSAARAVARLTSLYAVCSSTFLRPFLRLFKAFFIVGNGYLVTICDSKIKHLQLEARRLELPLEPRLRQPHVQLEGLACATTNRARCQRACSARVDDRGPS